MIKKLMLLFICISTLVSCDDKGEYKLTTFKLDQGREIQILASNRVEVSQAIFYQVRVNNKVVVPTYRIFNDNPDEVNKFKFSIITAKNGNLVGVLVDKYPSIVVALHDFTTNESWPRVENSRGFQDSRNVGMKLFEQLEKEHKELNLSLSKFSAHFKYNYTYIGIAKIYKIKRTHV